MSDPALAQTRPGIMGIVAGLYMEIAILIFCGLVLRDTGRTEGPVYDVVGPDFLPTTVAVIVAALTALQIAVQVMRAYRGATDAPLEPVGPQDVATGIAFGAVTAVYVALLAWRGVPFFILTAAFIALATVMVSRRWGWRDAAVGLAVGLILGIVLQLIFTRVLVIDLPT